MTRLLTALLLALSAGCGTTCRARGLVVTGTPAAGADVVLDVVRERAPCPRELRGVIAWQETAPVLWGRSVAGDSAPSACALDVRLLRLEPAPRSALAHEVGHWLWRQCLGRDGESGLGLDPDFRAWVDGVNGEALRRMSQ